jgi:hypothetical protein
VEVHVERLRPGGTRRLTFGSRSERATWAEVIRRWQSDEGFRTTFGRALADDPAPAFFWETPPVSRATTGQPFECVLVDAPGLAAVDADPLPFRAHLAGRAGVCTFDNLGGDATLVAPCADVGAEAYAHLAATVRRAPAEQLHELWHAVGEVLEQRLADAPCWVSTSGLGVYWTHVRLDARPKYYTHAPYRRVR